MFQHFGPGGIPHLWNTLYTGYLFPGYVYVFMDEDIAIAAICQPNKLSAMAQKNRANISEWEAYLADNIRLIVIGWQPSLKY